MMMRPYRVGVATLILLGACLFAPAASSQEQQPGSRAVFSSKSELVVLHVSVLDHKAGFVPGLPREAFSIFEDGRPQDVTYFQNEDSPVTVGLVIDCSGSMQPKRDAVIAAGLAFARSSNSQDEMFTVNFNEKIWPGLPPGKPFTSDVAELRQALLQSTTRGQTALFDAVQFALGRLENGRQQKKILIVISDGGDNASRIRFETVLDAAFRMDAVVYTIGLFDDGDRDAKPKLLKQFAAATGAEAFFPRRAEEVTRILERIARDIRSGYTIGYTPAVTVQNGAYHAVRVEVRSPDRRRLVVRARSGYYAAGKAGTR
jgi:Ca-activated chloride channel family protein